MDRATLTLLGAIYDAVDGHRSWDDVLARIEHRFDLASVILGHIDRTARQSDVFLATGVFTPDRIFRYNRDLAAIDPGAESLRAADPFEVVSVLEAWGDNPHGSGDPVLAWMRVEMAAEPFAGVRMESQSPWCQILGTHARLGRGGPTPEERRILRAVAMHLHRALATWQIVNRPATEGDYDLSLDRISVGAIVASTDGHIRFANAEAQRILSESWYLNRRSDGTLEGQPEALDRWLRAALAAAADPERAADGLSGEEARSRLTWTMTDDMTDRDARDACLIEAMPLKPRLSDRQVDSYSLVLLVDPVLRRRLATDRLAGFFALTAAEKETAAGVVEGLTRDEIAARRGVSPETVKTQIRAVLAKIHGRRESDIVRRAMLFASAVR